MTNVGELVLKAQDSAATLGEKHHAFGSLVAAFQDMAYAFAYALLGDVQHAEDAAQEAFISAWQKLDQLREPDAFPGWFRRIVLTECHRLTRGKRSLLTSLEAAEQVPSILASPQTAIERTELQKAMQNAIAKLPQNDRIVVVLFYLKGQSQREISTFLEVPLTTVAKRLYAARTRLAGLIAKDLKEEIMAHRPSRGRTFAKKVLDGIFDEYLGEYRYDLRPEIVVVIKRQGDKLISEAAGQRNELIAANDSDNELLTKEFDGRGRVVRDKQGRITHFVYYEFGREMGIARKINDGSRRRKKTS